MNTSVSLLERLRHTNPGEADWQKLHDIYLPLIQKWLARVPGLENDGPDLAQEVFVILIREIPRFERQREGSFRAWLRRVSVNKVRSLRKQRGRRPEVGVDLADGFLDRLSDGKSELALEWDIEHDRHVLQKLLTMVQPDFKTATWNAFKRFAIDGLTAAQVAEELNLSENAVLQAKSRILKRLREEAGELLA